MSGADSTTEVTPTGRYEDPSLCIDRERSSYGRYGNRRCTPINADGDIRVHRR